jgi:acyl-CoA hydrolase
MTARSKHGTSRIVPFLPEGSSVDVPAQLAHYVCTEYGIVNLRGLSGYERAEALIAIAHPDDREWLEREARAAGLLAPKFPVSMRCREGGPRRYPPYAERRGYKIPFHSDFWGFDWDPFQSGK